MKSPCCNQDFILRGRSKRRGELLLLCPNPECKNPKWQCREEQGSHPYQVKKLKKFSKSVHVNGRMQKPQYENLIREYGTFQKFLDFYFGM